MNSMTCFSVPFWVVIIESVALSLAALDEDKIRWCGGPLNPLETAKTTRVATAVLWSCKKEIVRLNISQAFIEQADRVCAIWRICYAVAEEAKNSWRKKYNVNFDSFVGALQRCAFPKYPNGVIYGLKTIDYFKNFVSG